MIGKGLPSDRSRRQVDRVLVEHMVPALALGRRSEPWYSGKAGAERSGVFPAALGQLVETLHLRYADGSLEVGEPQVVAAHFELVPRAHALVSKQPQPVGGRRVVGRQDAALGSRDVLGCVQRAGLIYVLAYVTGRKHLIRAAPVGTSTAS